MNGALPTSSLGLLGRLSSAAAPDLLAPPDAEAQGGAFDDALASVDLGDEEARPTRPSDRADPSALALAAAIQLPPAHVLAYPTAASASASVSVSASAVVEVPSAPPPENALPHSAAGPSPYATVARGAEDALARAAVERPRGVDVPASFVTASGADAVAPTAPIAAPAPSAPGPAPSELRAPSEAAAPSDVSMLTRGAAAGATAVGVSSADAPATVAAGAVAVASPSDVSMLTRGATAGAGSDPVPASVPSRATAERADASPKPPAAARAASSSRAIAIEPAPGATGRGSAPSTRSRAAAPLARDAGLGAAVDASDRGGSRVIDVEVTAQRQAATSTVDTRPAAARTADTQPVTSGRAPASFAASDATAASDAAASDAAPSDGTGARLVANDATLDAGAVVEEAPLSAARTSRAPAFAAATPTPEVAIASGTPAPPRSAAARPAVEVPRAASGARAHLRAAARVDDASSTQSTTAKSDAPSVVTSASPAVASTAPRGPETHGASIGAPATFAQSSSVTAFESFVARAAAEEPDGEHVARTKRGASDDAASLLAEPSTPAAVGPTVDVPAVPVAHAPPPPAAAAAHVKTVTTTAEAPRAEAEQAVRAAEALGHRRVLASGEAHGRVIVPELGRFDVRARQRDDGARIDVRVAADGADGRALVAAHAAELRAHVHAEVPQAHVTVDHRSAPAPSFEQRNTGNSRSDERPDARDARGGDGRGESPVRAEPVLRRQIGGRARFVL